MTVLTAQWLFPVKADPIYNGYLHIDEQGKILEIGSLDRLEAQHPSPVVGSILTPGLINVHTHIEQTVADSIPKLEHETFLDWLLKVVAFNRSSSSPEERQKRCQLGVASLLSAGTTCVNDIASASDSLEALDAAGLRGIVSLECFHPAAEVDAQRIAQIHQIYKAFSEPYQAHPLLKTGLSPHSPYNVSANAWAELLKIVQPNFVHTHVAEWVTAEMDYLQGKGEAIQALHQALLGKTFAPSFCSATPISHLNEAALLKPRLVLAHCLETTSVDRDLLNEHADTLGIAHCPRSNLALHGQTLQYADWKNTAVPMALGTDGRMSTEDLDLRAEARFAQQHHFWSDEETLEKLTCDAARVLGLEHEIGQLKPGYFADCVLWQTKEADSLQSAEQALEVMLSSQTLAQAVYVQGKLCWASQAKETHLKEASKV
jgi:cytosine/adenosine deaminase-related metal-dependent hydrolase